MHPVSNLLLPLLLMSLSSHQQQLGKDEHAYIACYKPALTLCSWRNSQQEMERAKRKHCEPRATLADLNITIPHNLSTKEPLHTVGRLDRDSEGLLLLTTDGALTSQVTGTGCVKTYYALVDGIPSNEKLDKLRLGGLKIRGSRIRPPVSVSMLTDDLDLEVKMSLPPPAQGMDRPKASTTWLKIQLNEGKNRQVRRMTASIGHRTIRLVRVQIGAMGLNGLQAGAWRIFDPQELTSTAQETS